MKISNYDIKTFSEFLLSLELGGKASRMRVRFVKLLSERLQILEEERLVLIKQFAHLDDSGEPKLETIDGEQRYAVANPQEFEREYNTMMGESFVIEQNEANKDMLLTIKDIVLNAEVKVSGIEALQYDRWCDTVERIEYK